MDVKKMYRIGRWINLVLWPTFLSASLLFGCLSCIWKGGQGSMAFATLFYVLLFLSGYTFVSWLFSNKAINALENGVQDQTTTIINIVFGLFFTFVPALKSLQTTNESGKIKFATPRLHIVIAGLLLAVGLFILDLITKLNVVKMYTLAEASGGFTPVILVNNFLEINYVINNSAAFGFGIGNASQMGLETYNTLNRVVYCCLAGGALLAIIIIGIIKRKKIPTTVLFLMAIIGAGALGNLVDRIFYSKEFLLSDYNGVVDWIDFYKIWAFNFNIADCCVVLGAITMIVYLIVEEINDTKKRRKEENAANNNQKVLSAEEKARLVENQREIEAKNKEESSKID